MENQHNPAPSAFRFHGNWRAFIPIVLSNLMLTIVTLGVYRFWATTRERQYLWGQTEFIDDRLEWTGKGRELFLGFVVVIVLIFIPLFGIQFLQQALLMQGQAGLAGLLTFAMIFGFFYLTGIARYRALRYRLSRTYWHGIRGGSNDQGFGYGWSYVWKTICGGLALYLLTPWAMMSLWNERWSKMSFGPHKFDAIGDHGETFKRFLLFYLLPILLLIVGGVGAAMSGIGGAAAAIGFVIVGLYGGLGIVAIAFYAKFFRVAVDGLSLSSLDFSFSARTKDWLLLLLGDVGLWVAAAAVIAVPVGLVFAAFNMGSLNFSDLENVANPASPIIRALPFAILALFFLPLALVGPFIRYRHWKFFVDYMQAFGEVDLDDLTQSDTAISKTGEGLLDAFDIGAI
jgi:uncharacterized membrane protein YjgN (DUF898 family)